MPVGARREEERQADHDPQAARDEADVAEEAAKPLGLTSVGLPGASAGDDLTAAPTLTASRASSGGAEG